MCPGLSEVPKVSVVILNYNGRRLLGDLLDSCLSSILASDYPDFEVLFVDNGSDDDSAGYILSEYGSDQRLRVVRLDKNYGFAAGNNLGAKHASPGSKYLAFLNTDVNVKQNWLRNMVEFAEHNEKPIVTSIIYDVGLASHIHGFFIIYPFCRFFFLLSKYPQKFQAISVDFPAGEAFLVKKDVFSELGGFDGEYFLYFDDADFGWRAKLRGYDVVVNPEAVVKHYRSRTATKTQKRRRTGQMLEKNRIQSCVKNLSYLSFPLFLIGEFYYVLALALSRNKVLTFIYAMIIKDLLFKTDWRRLLVKRKIVQSGRLISDYEMFLKGNKAYYEWMWMKHKKTTARPILSLAMLNLIRGSFRH